METLWDYHDMHHELRPCDIGIGPGGHGLGVVTDLYHRGYHPRVVFTGADAPQPSNVFRAATRFTMPRTQKSMACRATPC